MRPGELKTLVRLMLPMMGTQLCIMGMGFVDTAMSGHYSSVDLAGVALGGVVLWPLFMLFAGVLVCVCLCMCIWICMERTPLANPTVKKGGGEG